MRFLRSKGNTDSSDEAILEAYKNAPHPRYIEILFDRYCHLAFAVCMKYLKNEEDSKDAVIHIFERMHADLLKYNIQHFSHWLYTITKNYCLKELKGRQPQVPIEEVAIASAADVEETDFDLTQNQLDRLPEALAALSSEQMICIRMFYLEEKTYNEIAGKTGFNFKQVKSYIQNGKRNLRNYLEKNGNGQR